MENKNRRTFLVGLGRFAIGAAGLAVVKPRVLYSFPSVISPPGLFAVLGIIAIWDTIRRRP